ncbi:uncharacterized protein MONBRDRAFT_34495 [Monosiga brevicollis MX1]|uniref:Uncharacterized protein n=1 Tax=Monosiga brevicollis TaxID=81824 RepID=A9VC31_MONBE|nr:uncharacterized protein MONBRDRAFT_34495 [Monosiga brevicollis MX1]EDQ84953.1 predicted protein [Monosiga brevicollis MX1]|eukprot:XP_001750294.1 hypothetical protein [Monosiga brevicollis MX1]
MAVGSSGVELGWVASLREPAAAASVAVPSKNRARGSGGHKAAAAVGREQHSRAPSIARRTSSPPRRSNASLADLCLEDKRRVARLVHEVSRLDQEYRGALEQLASAQRQLASQRASPSYETLDVGPRPAPVSTARYLSHSLDDHARRRPSPEQRIAGGNVVQASPLVPSSVPSQEVAALQQQIERLMEAVHELQQSRSPHERGVALGGSQGGLCVADLEMDAAEGSNRASSGIAPTSPAKSPARFEAGVQTEPLPQRTIETQTEATHGFGGPRERSGSSSPTFSHLSDERAPSPSVMDGNVRPQQLETQVPSSGQNGLRAQDRPWLADPRAASPGTLSLVDLVEHMDRQHLPPPSSHWTPMPAPLKAGSTKERRTYERLQNRVQLRSWETWCFTGSIHPDTHVISGQRTLQSDNTLAKTKQHQKQIHAGENKREPHGSPQKTAKEKPKRENR